MTVMCNSETNNSFLNNNKLKIPFSLLPMVNFYRSGIVSDQHLYTCSKKVLQIKDVDNF